ncbi:hypothetical protein PC113_g767 [Phytophthora cactorum]|uniref:Uncharacterized protein n=1 Tax=Phytophthora cactorum TaxID=29920 RepID=A0A8T1A1R8_9STRA|nr:hypothetical protein PC113_g767 [Phytophthora cactorum]KAG2944115.1 hypothetical protein PC115_g460 [Phytophthora cactorum]KAG3104131.1 hypothetical protein PC121_g809 [Phytophthora cactorum]KAG4064211.1 hypothetical protein PC123_g1006 [Phytophthora cactorum]
MQSLPWWSFLGRNRRQVTQETCKMMQHAKLMSSAGLVSAKQEINDAVSELEARPTCIQRVYTNLTRVFNALADHPQGKKARAFLEEKRRQVTMSFLERDKEIRELVLNLLRET